VRADRYGRSIELQPVMFQAGEQGVMRNPDIANFLTNDLYVSPVSLQEAGGGHSHGTEVVLPKGRPVRVGDATLTFVKFEMSAHGAQGMGASGMKVGSEIRIARGQEQETIVPVMIYVPNAAPDLEPAHSAILGADVRLTAMNAGGIEAGESAVTVEVGSDEHGSGAEESLIVDASVKPFVGLLWLGFFVMMVGFGVSIAKRSKEA
jgi:cytochrome c-type biogenesis protein CcmF